MIFSVRELLGFGGVVYKRNEIRRAKTFTYLYKAFALLLFTGIRRWMLLVVYIDALSIYFWMVWASPLEGYLSFTSL